MAAGGSSSIELCTNTPAAMAKFCVRSTVRSYTSGRPAGSTLATLRRGVGRRVVPVGAARRLDLRDLLGEARRDRERTGPMEPLGDRRTRERHELVLRLQLLRLAVRPVAEHETVVRGADDLRTGLER